MKSASLLSLLLLWAAGAPAAELQDGLNGYAGTADATLYRDYPGNSNGGFPLIFSGATVNSSRRALIRFVLAQVPARRPVTQVQLTLVLDRSGLEAGENDVYSLHRLLAPWGEGTAASGDLSTGGIGLPAESGDATWASAFHGSAPWETPGGDFATTPSATLEIGRWDAIRPENNTYTFASEALAEDVRFWLANPANNYGWILIGPEAPARNARRFWSSEAEQAALRPKLMITETSLPADAWYLR